LFDSSRVLADLVLLVKVLNNHCSSISIVILLKIFELNNWLNTNFIHFEIKYWVKLRYRRLDVEFGNLLPIFSFIYVRYVQYILDWAHKNLSGWFRDLITLIQLYIYLVKSYFAFSHTLQVVIEYYLIYLLYQLL